MNNINTLRQHLFDTLQALQDKEKPMEIDRAKAISEVAQTIINSAKVEIDHLRVTGQCEGSDFIIPQKPSALPAASTTNTANGTSHITPIPGGNVISHRMR